MEQAASLQSFPEKVLITYILIKYDRLFSEMKQLISSIKQSLKCDNSLKDLKKHLWKLNSLWERIERNQTNYHKETDKGIDQDYRYKGLQDNYISIKIDLEAELQKIEKIESAKNSAREANLKLEIDNQHKVRAELEVKCQGQVTDLQKQINFSANKIQDAETSLQMVKQELLKVQHELNHLKHNSEKEIEIEACQKQNPMSRELEEYRLSTDELSMEVQTLTDKISAMGKEIEAYKEESILYDSSKLQHEKDLNELDLAKSEIQDLKNQIADLKKLSKEKELLMEEQREKEEEAKVEVGVLHVKLKQATDELAQWRQLTQDNRSTYMIPHPSELRLKIKTLLQDNEEMKAEKKAMESKIVLINNDCDWYIKKTQDLSAKIRQLELEKQLLMLVYEACSNSKNN